MADTERDTRVAEEAPAPNPPSVARQLGIGFWLSVGFLVTIVLLAVLAPILPIEDPNKVAVGGKLEGPRSGLWFGADSTGRDVFSLTIWGARISLLVGFLAILIGFLIGGRSAFSRVTSEAGSTRLSRSHLSRCCPSPR